MKLARVDCLVLLVQIKSDVGRVLGVGLYFVVREYDEVE